MVLDIDEDGITPLYMAISENAPLAKIRAILKTPENEVYTHTLDRNGASPLLLALIKKREFALIHLLLKKGAWITLNHAERGGLTSGHVAVFNAINNFKDNNEAAYKNDIEILQKLDAYKINWNIPDSYHKTAAKMLGYHPDILNDVFPTQLVTLR